MVFYGTDDGYQDGSFGEIPEILAHYENVKPARRENIHMISVVGGLYGLNMIPLWRPKKLTFFDINPVAISYFHIVRRVLTSSEDAQHFLQRLTDSDYEVKNEEERFVQENIALKQQGRLPRSRGSSKRSYEESWGYALDHFDLTKELLSELPLEIRTEPMESPDFRAWLRRQENCWIYCSNIAEFVYFDIEFDKPTNVVLLAIIFPQQTDLLDLAPLNGGPVKVGIRIPLTAERLA